MICIYNTIYKPKCQRYLSETLKINNTVKSHGLFDTNSGNLLAVKEISYILTIYLNW